MGTLAIKAFLAAETVSKCVTELGDAPLNRIVSALNNKDLTSTVAASTFLKQSTIKAVQDAKELFREKKNCLLSAAENDDIDAVRELLLEGIPAGGSKETTSDGNILISTHKTALHAAVRRQNIDM